MYDKIRCNPMNPRYGALPVPLIVRLHEVLWSYISIYLCASSLQNLAVPKDFYFPLIGSLRNDLADPVFDSVGLAGFKSWASAFLLALLPAHLLCSTVFPFSSFLIKVDIVGLGSSD